MQRKTIPRSMRVIWSVCASGSLDEPYILKAMEHAAREGVSGIEMGLKAIDRFISYRAFPKLRSAVDREKLKTDQAMLHRICERATQLGLRLGIWHHEIEGPRGLLDLMSELRAADGLIDLEKPLLYQFITEKCAEFLELFPAMNELVLTLTETEHVVAHRPFSKIPPGERIRRVLQAVADATERTGRQLVIRPFSAIRADELHVRDAIQRLKARNVSVMYKTEPFDWNPFLYDEPLIGSVKRYEARAETDAGAEYYGQAEFPVCYARYIQHRLDSARRKGASVAVIRVDRGSRYVALGHPLNEVNAIAPTHWALDPSRRIDDCWADWLHRRHQFKSKPLIDLLERTFDVIKKSLYIDGQSITHHAFPSMSNAKHVLVFSLFEERVSLSHLTEHWSMLPNRTTLTHSGILREKVEALALARTIHARFTKLSKGMNPCSRASIAESLQRLELLAKSFLALCRVIAAHTEEMWTGKVRTVASFDKEAARMVKLANQIEARFGPGFFRKMPAEMRTVVDGLTTERALEIPLRRTFAKQRNLVDYVLCGFATEGHRLAKRLHTGNTFAFQDRFVRATGIGEEQGISYELKAIPNRRLQLVVTLAGNGASAPGIVRIGKREFAFDPGPILGLKELRFDLGPQRRSRVRVQIFSVTPQPCWIATLTSSTANPPGTAQ